MNSILIYNKKPLHQSLLIFFTLLTGLVLLAAYFDFKSINLEGLLFLITFICCVLIAKSTFDRAATIESVLEVKKNTSRLSLASEGLYIELYKNSPIPYIIIDFDGHIKSANIAAVRMLGVKQSGIKGINIFNKIQCSKLEHLDMLVEKYHNDVSVSGEMVSVKRADHREMWALLSLFTFVDRNEGKIGLLTLVDVTRQKRAEDAKSEFVSLASHQLRTPIAGMKWSAELLLMDNPETLSERQTKYIDRLLTSINRMAVLVDDFLRVSRFELGTFQAEYKIVDLSKLFKDVLAEHENKVKQKNLSVKTFFDKSINNVLTDSNLIRMIVTNIYSNAVKYTRDKGTIHIGFGRKDSDMIITVADNGIGIPIGDQDEIFSKLFRGANAVRNVPDGTGLGLYIVKEAVTVLRGTVSYSGTENIGTTFEVILPLNLPKEDTSKKLKIK